MTIATALPTSLCEQHAYLKFVAALAQGGSPFSNRNSQKQTNFTQPITAPPAHDQTIRSEQQGVDRRQRPLQCPFVQLQVSARLRHLRLIHHRHGNESKTAHQRPTKRERVREEGCKCNESHTWAFGDCERDAAMNAFMSASTSSRGTAGSTPKTESKWAAASA